jgi:putative nucleotidyltransferase with HDIG domain
VAPPENLRQALGHLDSIPAVPCIARKILTLKINTDEGERALLELIETDPAILSRIIGLANSPLFGTGRKILTLHDAAALLGSKRVKMTALSFAMMSSLTRKSGGLLNIQNLWRHSLAVAMTMDTLAHLMPEGMRPSDDEIYLAGLLHDIGFLALDYLDTRLSDRFHTRLATAEPGRTVEEIEAEMLEMNHGELGAALGRHWSLPENIVAVLNYHHTPHDLRAAVGQPLVNMAGLAEKLLPTFCITEAAPPEIGFGEWQALGIDPVRKGAVMSAVERNIHEVASMFPD